MPQEPRFRPRDLLRQVQMQELAVAPDGESVVYARRTVEDGEYRKRLWRVPWRGGRPEQLTRGELDAEPRFSPDGSTLLFLSRRGGKMRPWLLPLGGGEPTEVAAPDGDVGRAEWSPDGKRVLLLAPSGEQRFAVGDATEPLARRIEDLTWRLDGAGIRDEFTSLWVVRARGGKAKRLTEPTFEVFDAAWSPDGTRIGFVADPRPEAKVREDPQAWVVPAAGGRPKRHAELPGEISATAWSPSGTLGLIGITEPADSLAAWAHYHLYVVERAGLRRLGAELDRSIAFLTSGDLYSASARQPRVLWLDDERLVAPVCDRGRGHLYRFGLDGSVERLVDGEVVCSDLAVGGGRVATVATESGRPGEVYAVEEGGGGLRRLTRDGSRWLGRRQRDPERFAVPHPDGHEVEAWLVPARRSGRRRPLVLQVHGGPHLAHGPAPWLEMLALADAGISVVYANPRGSQGYGVDFARAISGNWGDVDADDLLHVVDYAVAEGLGDEARLGILGLSYGGYMVNWLLGRRPGRFAAAVSENPVTDLASFVGTGDYGVWLTHTAAGVAGLGEGRERLADRSPATLVERNEAPLLLLQAERDMRCPPDQSEIVFAALRKLGRPVEMVRYPDESHLLAFKGRPDRRVDRLERIVDWFTRHL